MENFNVYTNTASKFRAYKEAVVTNYEAVNDEIELSQFVVESVSKGEKKQQSNSRKSKRRKKTNSVANDSVDDAVLHIESPAVEIPEFPGRITRSRLKMPNVAQIQPKTRKRKKKAPRQLEISSDSVENETYDLTGESDSEIEISPSLVPEVEEVNNSELSVKVWWKFSSIEKFQMRRYQKFATIFEKFAKLEGVSQNEILFTKNDLPIMPEDSPDSLGLTVADIIEGGIISSDSGEKLAQPVPAPAQTKLAGPDIVELKVLLKNRKEPLLVNIKKSQKMMVLMYKCSEDLNIPLDKLKFSFDGEQLDSNETPESLDLDGGECIEVHTSS